MGKYHRPADAQTSARDLLGNVYPYLLPLLLFFAVTAISRQFAVGFAAVCLLLALGKVPMANLRLRAGLPALAVVVYAAVCLLSGLWSHFGAYAGRESAKILVALAAFGLVLVRTKTDKLTGVLWSLNGVLAVVSVLCIDAGSWQVLARGFSGLMKLFKSSYPLGTMGYEAGVRITGIFSNANVSAGLVAFGLVISLYLYQTAGCKKGKLCAMLALGVEALAFFLSFSMGAMGAFALTCLVYVVCAGKGKRLGLFLLMLECVFVTLVCAFAAYPSLGTGSIVPVLLALVCGVVIWALDQFVGSRVRSALENKGKAVGIVGGVLTAVAALYAVLAFTVTGGVTLNAKESLSRAVYPAAGDYTVSVEGIDAQARVYTQNKAQLMMHTETALYEGPLSQAAFTVPEDSSVVWFVLEGDGELNAVTLSDGTELPLGYKLLPGFAANRLQGLKANQNFIQRLVFFQDGLKLWQERPLLGWGIGGVEGQLTAVQSFYYESRYIHNQFIQIMAEAGVLGLGSFLFLLGSALWLLLRRRKDEERDPIFAMLAACLTMMIAHSMTEVVWSAQMYQVVVFTVLAVLIIRYQQPMEKRAALAGRVTAVALWGVVLVFGGFQAGTLLAARSFDNVDRSMSKAEFVAALGRMDRLDVYSDADYKANRMVNALQSGGAVNLGVASKCARELADTEEFDACYNAAAYYHLPLQDMEGFFAVSRTGLMQEASNPAAWNSVFHLYAQAFQQLDAEHMEDFVTGVADLGDFLDAFNAGRMERITLDEGNQQLLDVARTLRSGGVTGEGAQTILAAVLG